MVRLPYGEGELTLRIPDGRLRLVEPARGARLKAPLEAFRESLGKPVGSPPLQDLVAGRKVAYLLDDATRSEPHQEFMQAVLERLGGAALVRCIIAVGSHERLSAGNRRIMEQFRAAAGGLGVRVEVSVHDCEDASLHVGLGLTPRGTPVEINRLALEADVFVITSDLKNHYFAGYSNPLKNFLPGVSSFAAVEHNHSFALDPDASFGRHPWHPDPRRRSNPVAEDMLDAVKMIPAGKRVFVLGAVTQPEGVIWAGAGDMEAVTREAIRHVDRAEAARVSPCRYLIVSPGGDPEDETLYNAQRGLELSRNGVKRGGEVLFLARCPKGVAPTPAARAEFYDRLTAPLPDVIAGLAARYVLYSHKAYKFAQFIQSVERISMVTDLPREQVEAAHMHKADDPQAVVDRWRSDSGEPILVTAHANKVALYA